MCTAVFVFDRPKYVLVYPWWPSLKHGVFASSLTYLRLTRTFKGKQ